MDDSFIGLIVFIGEENQPIGGQCVGVDCKAVVLGGDEATLSGCMSTRLIVTTVTVPGRMNITNNYYFLIVLNLSICCNMLVINVKPC